MKSLGLEAPPLERRLAAILAADVEGYSRLMHGDEEATLATLSAQRATVDALIMRHKGRIANTAGDSVLAEFTSVLGAVHCAVEIQEALARANAREKPKDGKCAFGSAAMSVTSWSRTETYLATA
jgi:adenylate cyclase